jgi:hypothetical protein
LSRERIPATTLTKITKDAPGCANSDGARNQCRPVLLSRRTRAGRSSPLAGQAAIQLVRAWASTPNGGVVLLIAGTFLIRVLTGWLMGLGVDESYMVATGRELRLATTITLPPLGGWSGARSI